MELLLKKKKSNWEREKEGESMSTRGERASIYAHIRKRESLHALHMWGDRGNVCMYAHVEREKASMHACPCGETGSPHACG